MDVTGAYRGAKAFLERLCVAWLGLELQVGRVGLETPEGLGEEEAEGR